MPEVSTFRLYLLRATYLLLVVGLAFDQWPGIFHHPDSWSLMRGVVCSMLAAVSLLALIGLKHPLLMLPVLLFELLWKSIWLSVFAYPKWAAHQMDSGLWESVYACGAGLVIFPLVIPWRYVWNRYVMHPGDRWAKQPPRAPDASPAR